MNPPPVTLPPACYDILEASIRKHGIGAGRYHTFDQSGFKNAWIPCCFVGHFDQCFGVTREAATMRDSWGVGEGASDRAVRAINIRKGVKPDLRVTWEEFRDEMRFVRESCDLSAHDSSIPCNVRTPFDVSRLAGHSPQRV